MEWSPFTEKVMSKVLDAIDRFENRYGLQMYDGEQGDLPPTGIVESQKLRDINHNTERPYKFVLMGKDMDGTPQMFIGPRNYKTPQEALKWSEWWPQSRKNYFDEGVRIGCLDWNRQTYVFKSDGFDEATKDFENAQSEVFQNFASESRISVYKGRSVHITIGESQDPQAVLAAHCCSSLFKDADIPVSVHDNQVTISADDYTHALKCLETVNEKLVEMDPVHAEEFLQEQYFDRTGHHLGREANAILEGDASGENLNYEAEDHEAEEPRESLDDMMSAKEVECDSIVQEQKEREESSRAKADDKTDCKTGRNSSKEAHHKSSVPER